MPRENVLESLYKMRKREYVQVQTVLALIEREIDQHRSTPSCEKLKTLVRRHTDHMIRTRNFKVRNERVETGVVKSQKGKNVSVERKMGDYQWQKDSVQEETRAVGKAESHSYRHFFGIWEFL